MKLFNAYTLGLMLLLPLKKFDDAANDDDDYNVDTCHAVMVMMIVMTM